MIFATDHPAGDKIMTSLYNAAANEFPVMRRDARRRRTRLAERKAGVQSLFGDDQAESRAVGPQEKLYQHAPPWTPYGMEDTS